jgi:hypothetical protein
VDSGLAVLRVVVLVFEADVAEFAVIVSVSHNGLLLMAWSGIVSFE